MIVGTDSTTCLAEDKTDGSSLFEDFDWDALVVFKALTSPNGSQDS
jgi:hypothetical protein